MNNNYYSRLLKLKNKTLNNRDVGSNRKVTKPTIDL